MHATEICVLRTRKNILYSVYSQLPFITDISSKLTFQVNKTIIQWINSCFYSLSVASKEEKEMKRGGKEFKKTG